MLPQIVVEGRLVQALSQWVIRHKRPVVAAFVLAALAGALLQLSVSTNYNILDYLPRDAPSTKALSLMTEEFEAAIPNARVMLSDVSIPEALVYKQQLMTIAGVTDVLWLDDVVDVLTPLEMADSDIVAHYYKDRTALLSLIMRAGDEVRITNAIYDIIGDHNRLSGTAADKATLQTMTGSETQNAMLVIVPLIIVILLVSTTSWLEPLLVLAAIGVSIAINMGTNLALGEVSFVTKSVSPILQLAVSLDYAIFLLHSFDHYRQQNHNPSTAMQTAMGRAFPAIAASAATTAFGFLALVFMRFGIGADLGINLAKGIVFSFISVIVFLPALTLTVYPWLDRTRHRKLLPDFKGIGRFVHQARIPVLILVLLFLAPSYLAQGRNHFVYGEGQIADTTRSGRDAQAINARFGQSTPLVLLVPRGDVLREELLSQELSELKAVTQVVSYARLIGGAIPPEIVGEAIAAQFYSANYARMVVYTNTASEGERAFAVVEEVQSLARSYYGNEVYFTGPSVTLYDMRNVVTRDNKTVNRLAVGAICAVLILTFKSLAIPLILLITIQTAIWINLATPYFVGSQLSFVGFLIISAVQLGATVDYAILLSSHYMTNRRDMPPREALHQTLAETVGSILVSASILSLAGGTLWLTSSNPMVSELGMLLGRGTAFSMLMVFFFLPAALSLFDRLIERTTLGITFYRERN
jgi:predicted RND superfamily exporter protein